MTRTPLTPPCPFRLPEGTRSTTIPCRDWETGERYRFTWLEVDESGKEPEYVITAQAKNDMQARYS